VSENRKIISLSYSLNYTKISHIVTLICLYCVLQKQRKARQVCWVCKHNDITAKGETQNKSDTNFTFLTLTWQANPFIIILKLRKHLKIYTIYNRARKEKKTSSVQIFRGITVTMNAGREIREEIECIYMYSRKKGSEKMVKVICPFLVMRQSCSHNPVTHSFTNVYTRTGFKNGINWI
jgi:hypothetical protein